VEVHFVVVKSQMEVGEEGVFQEEMAQRAVEHLKLEVASANIS